jgi:hypothetical protein
LTVLTVARDWPQPAISLKQSSSIRLMRHDPLLLVHGSYSSAIY